MKHGQESFWLDGAVPPASGAEGAQEAASLPVGDEGAGLAVTRRDILGGTLALGTLVLFGCQGGSNSSLPGPQWPSAMSEQPTVALPPQGTKQVTPVGPPPPTPAMANFNGRMFARSQWTRQGIARPREINPMNGINRITVHHSGMYYAMPGNTVAVAREIDNIRSGHVGRGWADIGYHYVIDPFGNVWEGRPTTYQGAHVQDNNEHNLGIMLLGNFNQQTPTPAAITSLDKFVATQAVRYRVPMSRVYTHRELRPTDCPGNNLQRYMVSTRQRGGNMARMV